jgi:hypothetical protein
MFSFIAWIPVRYLGNRSSPSASRLTACCADSMALPQRREQRASPVGGPTRPLGTRGSHEASASASRETEQRARIRSTGTYGGYFAHRSANLDLMRSICVAWERGDFSSAEWAHPEIEYVIADGPAPGSWTGLAGIAEGWRSWVSAWENWSTQIDEYRELDSERVLILTHNSGRGRTSGLELGQMQTKGAGLFHEHAVVSRIDEALGHHAVPAGGAVRRRGH